MERRTLTPYSESVDGLTLPAPLAGHPALDFCNTVAGWDGVEPGDYLSSYDHLVVFTAAAGLLPEETAGRLRRRARRVPRDAEAALARARDLRRSLYAALLGPRPGRDWDRVAADARAAESSLVLELRGGRGAWRFTDRVGLAMPRLAIARSASGLLTSPEIEAVRACPGRGCGWLFLDRAGRRRWCTMAVCGNRAKVQRFSRRRREAPARTPNPTVARRSGL
jgi:predicted RNA-binding Zn ribbon-like protein